MDDSIATAGRAVAERAVSAHKPGLAIALGLALGWCSVCCARRAAIQAWLAAGCGAFAAKLVVVLVGCALDVGTVLAVVLVVFAAPSARPGVIRAISSFSLGAALNKRTALAWDVVVMRAANKVG